VLIELARQLQLISGSAFQITLSAMLLSMFIAPFLIARAARACPATWDAATGRTSPR
jgi:CPA2 family monovalent cation:H+ antiporter-2